MLGTHRLAVLGFVLAASGCAPVPGRQPAVGGPTPAVVASARSIAIDWAAEQRLPATAIVVLHGDEPVVALDSATVFQLGSISKQFLAALVVALADEGRLALDAPVRDYLPDFPGVPSQVLVRHLLTHTSGIRELFLLPGAAAAFDDLDRTTAELADAIRLAPADFPPAARWSYSNSNYTLLAFLVERVTGRSFEEGLANRFFGPHRLTSLGACPSVQTRPIEARGHVRADSGNAIAAPENMRWIRGDGGLCGSAADVARWLRLLATGRIVSSSAWSRMIAPAQLLDGSMADYGFGLSVARPDGVEKVAHNGAMRGFSASAAYYPASAMTVVVLVNRGDVRTESLERKLARHLMAIPEPERRPAAIPIDLRRSVPGVYSIGVFDIEVSDRDGILWLQMPPPGPTVPLRYIGDGRFVSERDPDAVELRVDGPDRLRMYMAAMHWYAVRPSR